MTARTLPEIMARNALPFLDHSSSSIVNAFLVSLPITGALWGVQLAETYKYFRRYKNDPTGLKCLVISLFVLQTAYFIAQTAVRYHFLSHEQVNGQEDLRNHTRKYPRHCIELSPSTLRAVGRNTVVESAQPHSTCRLIAQVSHRSPLQRVFHRSGVQGHPAKVHQNSCTYIVRHCRTFHPGVYHLHVYFALECAVATAPATRALTFPGLPKEVASGGRAWC
ncbi:hypothetical protein T439DRAFT_195850 [Meredithblackwellia eburnea MCA 4105]